ncbi:unnamed protein product [Leptidea sinapis]|uniref:Invertebrate defensins family profile domain-containing protein n=1 Tax=Leptidea sinapis TaxID=189913 RepID=A0A5E4PWQ9_9NEOP|nr:unnamed protein product [Leptidea sinapis]
MKSLFIVLAVFLVTLICVTRSNPLNDIEQHDMKSVVDSSTEVVELFSGSEVSRQRICTAALCRSVCQSLGFPISFCNIQLICVCRHSRAYFKYIQTLYEVILTSADTDALNVTEGYRESE